MRYSFEFTEQEFEKFSYGSDGKFELIVNGTKYDAYLEKLEKVNKTGESGDKKGYLRGFAVDTKQQEIAQAKAEVNRTKEAHKEAQRKLSALMEEENVK